MDSCAPGHDDEGVGGLWVPKTTTTGTDRSLEVGLGGTWTPTATRSVSDLVISLQCSGRGLTDTKHITRYVDVLTLDKETPSKRGRTDLTTQTYPPSSTGRRVTSRGDVAPSDSVGSRPRSLRASPVPRRRHASEGAPKTGRRGRVEVARGPVPERVSPREDGPSGVHRSAATEERRTKETGSRGPRCHRLRPGLGPRDT